MNRFLHECFSDPVLGLMMAIALLFVMFMTWLIIKDKLKRRRLQQRLEHKRGEKRERRTKASHAAERPS